MTTEQGLAKVIEAMAKINLSNYVTDMQIVQKSDLELRDVRDYIDILEERDFVKTANSVNRHCAVLTEHGRAALRDPQYTKQNTPSTVIHVTGNEGVIVNANSTLRNVSQTIHSSSHLPQNSKDALETLINQLNDALKNVPEEHAEDAEAVAETAKILIQTLDKEKPNKVLVGISAEGLEKAAKNLAPVTPKIMEVVRQILACVK